MTQGCKDKCGNIIVPIIILMGMIVFLFWAIKTGVEKTREHRELIEQSIGKTVVINNDTLVVTNYQQGGFGTPNGFMLSNGVLVDERIIVKEDEK